MLFAERAIFFELQPFGIILFVLHGVVISLFALRAFKRNFRSVYGSHFGKTPCKKITPLRSIEYIAVVVIVAVIIAVPQRVIIGALMVVYPVWGSASLYSFKPSTI